MKTAGFLLCCLLIVTGTACADPAPEEIAGVRWGSTISDVRTSFSKREGLIFDSPASSGTRLRFTGGTFAGFEVDSWELAFGEKGLFFASVLVKESADADAFKKMKQAITEKYGGGRSEAIGSRSVTYNWINQQWENGSVSKPSPKTTWTMQTSFTRQTIHIQCWPGKKNRVHVAYQNQTLAQDSAKAPPKPDSKKAKADL